jgi:hypothetical protein
LTRGAAAVRRAASRDMLSESRELLSDLQRRLMVLRGHL